MPRAPSSKPGPSTALFNALTETISTLKLATPPKGDVSAPSDPALPERKPRPDQDLGL